MANTETKTNRTTKTLLDSTGNPAQATAEMAGKAADTAAFTTEAAASAARNVADAAFSVPQFEVPEAFRSIAEQTLTQTRDAYSRMRDAAGEATDLMEGSFEATRDNLRDVQFKALDAAKNNADATFDFMRKLLTVTSVADAVQIQSTFARERFEAMVDYSKDVQTVMTKATTEAAKPARALFDRTLSQSKAA